MTRYVATQDFVDQFTGRSYKKDAGVRPFPSRSPGLADDQPDDRPNDPARFLSLVARGMIAEVNDEAPLAGDTAPAAPKGKAARGDD